MILGMGTDIIDIKRIESVIDRYGDRFKKRIFTTKEIAKCESRRLSVNSYAKRYAVKEACSKALGTGFRKGVYWRDIEIINSKSGKPELYLHNGALEILKNLTPPDCTSKIDVTITDEYPYAQAIVIITYEK